MSQAVRKWVLVTGASGKLSLDEVEVSRQVGAMLAREGYGLVIGDWQGVDAIARTAFLEALPIQEQPQRIKHVANFIGESVVRVPGADVLEADGEETGYDRSAIIAADAGIVISGRQGSKPAMDALLRDQKPVLPIAFLGHDAFEVFRDILANWNEQPVAGITERQFLELMKPWRRNPQILSRTLHAALVTEPEIFISYRRDDVPAAAGRVFDELAYSYGQRAVFIDYANLSVGENLQHIIPQVQNCRVLVSIIGPTWNIDRLKRSDDYVRRELEAAENKGICVIPLLVGRSTPPVKEQIPESLRFLWDLKFSTLQVDEWQSSIERLKKAIDNALLSH